MKYLHVLPLALALGLYCSPAMAQHPHPGGSMGNSGMGHSMGADRGNLSHGNMNSHDSSNSSHRMTMDQQLSNNTRLSDKIQSLTGMSAQDACNGFKNLGQCVAAAHVSQNLGISFGCLKSDMTGQAPQSSDNCPAGTGSKSLSLGKSIQTLSPDANSKTEAKKAMREANQDLKDSKS